MPAINSTTLKNVAAVAASTALTNSSTATVLDQKATIPANYLQVGDVIKIRAAVIATATNSTNTLALALQMGTAGTSADQDITTIAAFDNANDDVAYFDVHIVIRTIGASGTMVATGVRAQSVPLTHDAGGVVVANLLAPFLLGSTTIDTTSAQIISVLATWSAASAANSCRLDVLDVAIDRKSVSGE